MPIKINPPEYLDFLFRTGHFWNPLYPDANEVTQDDLPSLTLDHPLVKQATASWQALDKNFGVLSFLIHLRSIIADGDIGPVTAQMAHVARCPLPDYPLPPGAALPRYSDDPYL